MKTLNTKISRVRRSGGDRRGLCKSRELVFGNTTITSVTLILAGDTLPEYCQVQGVSPGAASRTEQRGAARWGGLTILTSESRHCS